MEFNSPAVSPATVVHAPVAMHVYVTIPYATCTPGLSADF